MLLGYTHSRSNRLKAVGLKSGNELWNNKVEHNYGWNQVLQTEEDFRFIHQIGMPVAHLQVPFKQGQVMGNKLLLPGMQNQLLFIDLDEAVN